jgi:hypothetical protein
MDAAWDAWWTPAPSGHITRHFKWEVPVWVPPNHCFGVGFEPVAGAIFVGSCIVFREIAEPQAIESAAA